MSELTEWLNSGRYVYVILSESGYQENQLALESWPDAVVYGEYRMINLDKSKARFFYDWAVNNGFDPVFGISETTPMMLTWDEAKQFAAEHSTTQDEITNP